MSDERDRELSRRRLLTVGMGVGLGLGGVSLLTVLGDLVPKTVRSAANHPPAKGDLLVFSSGSQQGQTITPEGVSAGGPQVLAWPMDPVNRVIRDQNHLNLILLIRAEQEDWFDPAERPHTAARVAAYSAVCTHLCCSVSDWVPKPFSYDPHGYLFCPCHKSHYDPWNGAKVLAGPAPRPLPTLPLALSGGQLVAAGGFLTPPGCSTA